MKKRGQGQTFCSGRYAVINNRDLNELLTVKELIEVSIDPAPTNYGIEISRRRLAGNPRYASEVSLLAVDRKKFNYRYDETSCLLYEEMIDYLNTFYNYYTECEATVIITERQTDKSQLNEKITQHTLSFFSLLARTTETKFFVIDIAADERRKFLGLARGMGKAVVKKTSDESCDKLLLVRGDYRGRQLISNYSDRSHDISDCINQAEAFFQIIGIATTPAEPLSYNDV